VNELVGGQHTGAKGFMFFGVNVDLTENGIGNSKFCFWKYLLNVPSSYLSFLSRVLLCSFVFL